MNTRLVLWKSTFDPGPDGGGSIPEIALRDNRYLCHGGPVLPSRSGVYEDAPGVPRQVPARRRGSTISEESGMAACAPTMEMETEAAGA